MKGRHRMNNCRNDANTIDRSHTHQCIWSCFMQVSSLPASYFCFTPWLFSLLRSKPLMPASHSYSSRILTQAWIIIIIISCLLHLSMLHDSYVFFVGMLMSPLEIRAALFLSLSLSLELSNWNGCMLCLVREREKQRENVRLILTDYTAILW